MKAQELDSQAKALATDYKRSEALLLAVLMAMQEQRVFAALNWTGIFEYCVKGLGLSEAQAFYFKSVAVKAKEVPELKTAVLQGELTLSQARRITPVVTVANSQEWIAKARSLPQKQLEQEVKAINPSAHPKERIRKVSGTTSELKVAIDASTQEDLQVLQDVLSRKLGRAASLQEVVQWAMGEFRRKMDPQQKAKKDFLRKSPPPQPGRRKVPQSVKAKVLRKEGMQCSYTSQDGRRCNESRWIQMHHLKEVSKGGLNTLENLTLLCFQHHAMAHGRVPGP